MGKTPVEDYVKRKMKELEKTEKMDKELSKYGRKVHGGMMWTVGDMQRFFEASKKKRRK